MANVDAPLGMRPIRHRNGAPYNGAANPYLVPSSDATALFIGDPVVVTGTANTAQVEAPGVGTFKAGELPTVIIATAGGTTNAITGCVVAFGANPSNLENQYRLASTDRIVWVADDPDLVFEMQEDSVGGALAETAVGSNVQLIAGTGSTITGLSGWEIDSNTTATTATHQLRLERLVRREDNEVGNQANWEVSINFHTMTRTLGA